MRSWRVLVEEVLIDGVPVAIDYADVFLVVREGDEVPGPNDWEATVRTSERTNIRPGRHSLGATSLDGDALCGDALLRFSDGHQHLFRGDSSLDGSALVTS